MKDQQAASQKNKPSAERILRAVVTSTTIETGQDPDKLVATMQEKRIKYAHVHLAL
jgi:hypothetical protein